MSVDLKRALVGMGFLLCLTSAVEARQKLQGVAGIDGRTIALADSSRAPLALKTFPRCTVSVFIAGTDMLARIYTDEAGAPKANPFNADSVTAAWSFYADNGIYEARFSGTGVTSPFTQGPFTVSDPREVYNIRNFGGLCNETSNDETAVHAAFSAAQKGGTVYVPGICTIATTITPAAGTIIEGGGASTNGLGGAESYQLRTATPNMAIITIAGRRNGIIIRNLTFRSSTQTGTTAIKFFGRYGQSSNQFLIENSFIKGFDKAISAATDTSGGAGEWQCDNVTIRNSGIAEVNYGIWIDTQNADYWKIENVSIAAHYGIYMNKVGFITLDQVVGTNTFDPGGLPAELAEYGPGSTFITYTAANDGITCEDCQDERYTNTINTKSSVGAAVGNRITLNHSYPGAPIKLRFQQELHSHGSFYVQNSVKALGAAAGALGNDIRIYSSGDQVLDCSKGACRQAAPGSTAFDLSQSTNSFVISEFGRARTRIDASSTGGLTVKNHLGVGNQDSSVNAILTISPTGAEHGSNTSLIRLATPNAAILYDLFRDNLTGYLNYTATQAAARGFWFNSPTYTPTHYFLTNRSITDGVTNSTTKLKSATANFVAGDAGAQAVIASTSGVLVTSIASVTDSTTVVLASAPAWSASDNNVIITKSSGVSDTVGTGAPSGACATGSTYRNMTGGAGSSFYVCEGGSWAAK
ncbi:MAG TPA: hypothetical protein VF708_05820 [Pyrinomonadaceae bacterium]